MPRKSTIEGNGQIKFPTSFIKRRRKELGLTSREVQQATGIQKWAYQKLEQRGEIPEGHIPALALALDVSQTQLWIEKLAPMIQDVFSIDKRNFTAFVKSHSQR